MLQFAVLLLEWLPQIFTWLLAPLVVVPVSLALVPRTRPRVALAFIIAAAVSASFLSIETAALSYVCCDQARLIFSLLLDLRPGVTASFMASLLGGLGTPLLGLAPMAIAAIATGLSAFALRGRQRSARDIMQTEASAA